MTLDPKAMQKQAEMEAEALRRAMASVANAPKMEVRKHRPHRAGSEGGGYTAQLWLDGKHAADLSNSGDGGCDRFYWHDDAARARFADFVKAMPEVPVFGMNLPASPDLVVGSLVEQASIAKRCKTHVIFVDVNCSTWSSRGPFTAAAKAAITKKYGTVTFLNETVAGQTAQ